MKKTLVIALVAASLGLVGCQKDDSSSASDMQSNTTSTATTPAATTPAAMPAQEKDGSKS